MNYAKTLLSCTIQEKVYSMLWPSAGRFRVNKAITAGHAGKPPRYDRTAMRHRLQQHVAKTFLVRGERHYIRKLVDAIQFVKRPCKPYLILQTEFYDATA